MEERKKYEVQNNTVYVKPPHESIYYQSKESDEKNNSEIFSNIQHKNDGKLEEKLSPQIETLQRQKSLSMEKEHVFLSKQNSVIQYPQQDQTVSTKQKRCQKQDASDNIDCRNSNFQSNQIFSGHSVDQAKNCPEMYNTVTVNRDISVETWKIIGNLQKNNFIIDTAEFGNIDTLFERSGWDAFKQYVFYTQTVSQQITIQFTNLEGLYVTFKINKNLVLDQGKHDYQFEVVMSVIADENLQWHKVNQVSNGVANFMDLFFYQAPTIKSLKLDIQNDYNEHHHFIRRAIQAMLNTQVTSQFIMNLSSQKRSYNGEQTGLNSIAEFLKNSPKIRFCQIKWNWGFAGFEIEQCPKNLCESFEQICQFLLEENQRKNIEFSFKYNDIILSYSKKGEVIGLYQRGSPEIFEYNIRTSNLRVSSRKKHTEEITKYLLGYHHSRLAQNINFTYRIRNISGQSESNCKYQVQLFQILSRYIKNMQIILESNVLIEKIGNNIPEIFNKFVEKQKLNSFKLVSIEKSNHDNGGSVYAQKVIALIHYLNDNFQKCLQNVEIKIDQYKNFEDIALDEYVKLINLSTVFKNQKLQFGQTQMIQENFVVKKAYLELVTIKKIQDIQLFISTVSQKFQQIDFMRFLILYNGNHQEALVKTNLILSMILQKQLEEQKIFNIVRIELDVNSQKQQEQVDELINNFQAIVTSDLNQELSILAGEYCLHYDFTKRMLYFGNIISEYQDEPIQNNVLENNFKLFNKFVTSIKSMVQQLSLCFYCRDRNNELQKLNCYQSNTRELALMLMKLDNLIYFDYCFINKKNNQDRFLNMHSTLVSQGRHRLLNIVQCSTCVKNQLPGVELIIHPLLSLVQEKVQTRRNVMKLIQTLGNNLPRMFRREITFQEIPFECYTGDYKRLEYDDLCVDLKSLENF